MHENEMHHDPSEAKRLYVIVRADIPVGYQMAQACHAAAAIGAEQPQALATYPTIVILNAYDEDHLRDHFVAAGQTAVPFHEPDLNDEMTAFAVFASGEQFANLELAGGTTELFVSP